MWFRLALKLGCTVSELQDRMSSAEFGEWIAYYSLEPFGERHDDIRMGTIASVTANVNRPVGGTILYPKDFMPWVPEVVTRVAPTGESEAARVFGINLSELKASGKKTFVFKNPGVERSG